MLSLRTIADLEDALSRPSDRDVAFLRALDGDILILGAGGKMGPSLARLCRRAADKAGKPRRVIAASRCDPVAIGRPAQRHDVAGVTGIAQEKCAIARIPYLHGRIVAARSDTAVVRRPG